MFVQRMVHELRALIYNVVEIKCIVVILLLESVHTEMYCRKILYLDKDVPVHSEQTEPKSVVVACFSRKL